MNGHTSSRITHWYTDEWCTGKEATTQEKLQEIAGKIGKNCKIKEIVDNGHSIVTIYENEALSIRYWIHDSFGQISEITEARFFC